MFRNGNCLRTVVNRGRIHSVLSRALGATEPEVETLPKTTKLSKYGLKEFKPDDRMYIKTDVAPIKNNPKRNFRQKVFVQSMIQQTQASHTKQRTHTQPHTTPAPAHTTNKPEDTWPEEFSPRAMMRKFRIE